MKINKILLPALLLLPFCLISDWLIHQHLFFKQEYWGLYDNFVHGVIAVLVLFPFFKNISYKQIIAVFLIASLLDVDHFAVNFSFSLTKAISLTMRPPTHSLTFAVAAALLVFLFRKKWDWSWIVFAAIASHVVRDAYGGGTPIFYPSKISMIPYWSYLAVEYLLLITSQMIGGNKSK